MMQKVCWVLADLGAVALFAICRRRPSLNLLVRIVALLAWGLVSVGGLVLVAWLTVSHLPGYSPGAAASVALVLVGCLWFVLGAPMLVRSVRQFGAMPGGKGMGASGGASGRNRGKRGA